MQVRAVRGLLLSGTFDQMLWSHTPCWCSIIHSYGLRRLGFSVVTT